MNNLIQILDYGSSEYRLGYQGDVQAISLKVPDIEQNLKELFDFYVASRPNSGQHSVLVIEKNVKNNQLRSQISKFMFETLEIDYLYFARSAVLSLFSVGKSSGIVVENSETSCEFLCVEDSFVDQKLIQRSSKNVVSYYKENIDKKLNFKDFRQSIANQNQTNQDVILPDGQRMFLQNFANQQSNVITNKMLQKFPSHKQCILTGQVFNNDLIKKCFINKFQGYNFEILRPQFCQEFEKNSSFIGASIFTSIKGTKCFFVNRKEYEEVGSEAIDSLMAQLNKLYLINKNMPRATVDEKLVQDMLGEDFFYEHGTNPNFKNLPQFLAQNSENGKHYDFRTPYIGDSVKKLPQRDIEDLLDRDFKLNSVFRLFPAFTISFAAMVWSIASFRNFLPVGRYGVRKISQTNFYKAWGPIGVAGICALPLGGLYQFKQISSYFFRLCYERIILQDRDWSYKRIEELDIQNMYFFLDTPMATGETLDRKGQLRPSFNEACKRVKQAPLPLWVKDK